MLRVPQRQTRLRVDCLQAHQPFPNHSRHGHCKTRPPGRCDHEQAIHEICALLGLKSMEFSCAGHVLEAALAGHLTRQDRRQTFFQMGLTGLDRFQSHVLARYDGQFTESDYRELRQLVSSRKWFSRTKAVSWFEIVANSNWLVG